MLKGVTDIASGAERQRPVAPDGGATGASAAGVRLPGVRSGDRLASPLGCTNSILDFFGLRLPNAIHKDRLTAAGGLYRNLRQEDPVLNPERCDGAIIDMLLAGAKHRSFPE